VGSGGGSNNRPPSTAEEIGSNDFMYGFFRKEVKTTCEEVMNGTTCVQVCMKVTTIYDGTIPVKTMEDQEVKECDP